LTVAQLEQAKQQIEILQKFGSSSGGGTGGYDTGALYSKINTLEQTLKQRESEIKILKYPR